VNGDAGELGQFVRPKHSQNSEQGLARVRCHVERSLIKAENSATKCVDGRYRADQSQGALSLAGGDLGLCLAGLGAGLSLSADQAWRAVGLLCRRRDRPFCWHTDHHVHPYGINNGSGDHRRIGCGHCQQALDQAELYGLRQSQVQQLFELVFKSQADGRYQPNIGQSCQMRLENLSGDHQEQAILVIDSATHTVRPLGPDGSSQYFVYDRTRAQQLLRDLAGVIKENYPVKLGPLLAGEAERETDIIYQQLEQAAAKQLNATLGLLSSSRGKPIYTVTIDQRGQLSGLELSGGAPTVVGVG